MAVKALDLGDIFPFFFDNVSINTYYKRVMDTSLFLSSLMPKTTFLVVLILFTSLALVDRRLLGVFATRYLSGRGVSGFILFRVLFLLFCRLVLVEIVDVNFLSA